MVYRSLSGTQAVLTHCKVITLHCEFAGFLIAHKPHKKVLIQHTVTKLLIFQDQLYVYGQISTSEGEEFEIATMNSARRFVLWTKIDQAAFEDGGGYGEEEEANDGYEDVTDRALLLEIEGLVKRGMRDMTTLVNITVTVHFTRKFRLVM